MYCRELNTKRAKFMEDKDVLQKPELKEKLRKTIEQFTETPSEKKIAKRLQMWAN